LEFHVQILRPFLTLMLLLMTAGMALAHPHAWITLRSEIVINDKGLMTGVAQEWLFDDAYAQIALEGLDADKDGIFSEAEIKPLTEENIQSLREFDYFTTVRQNGAKLAIGDVTKARQIFKDQQLILYFEVPLTTPVDPKASAIQVKVYDPDFFIAYDYAADRPFGVSGTLPSGCTTELLPLPTDEELEKQRDFLATKGPDWKPETEEDFGAIFARPLMVQCASGGAAVVSPVIDKGKLLVQQRGVAANISFLDNPVLWTQVKQRSFYGQLSAAMRSMKSSNTAVWTLLSLSFLYGILHAAGPGHGKAVISTWLLATENDLRRGVLIAFLSAFIQAMTAIVLVSVLFLLVASAGSVARNVSGYLESASYAMIAGLGLYLIWTAFKPSHHEHHEHHGVAHHGHDHHGHDHKGHDHAHVARPQDLRGDWSLTKAFTLAFATGIRPCTGAILVLVFANSIGLYWAGIVSTLAMGIGVFLAVALIAAVTVYAKQYAMKLAAGRGHLLLPRLLTATRLVGGVVIVGIGTILLLGSLGSAPAMA
jgi:nickel/cobalt transporter (NicO) family protein